MRRDPALIVVLALLTASCGAATSAPQPRARAEDSVDPARESTSPPPTEPEASGDTASGDPASNDPASGESPYLGEWGCRGPISHVAMSYDVTLELHASGRFELRYSDVTPNGGRVLRMQGDWETGTSGDELGLHAVADNGSETTWIGDMHREQHRRGPDGPSFASQRRQTGVSTAERRWVVLDADTSGTLQIRLDPELATRVGRAVMTDGAPTWPRCDPGRFNR